MSLYLVSGKPADALENMCVLGELDLLIALVGLPVVIAGDMNNTPQEVADTGWLQRHALVPLIPEGCEYTCSSGKRLLIDFFMVSASLEGLCSSFGRKAPWSTHLPVELQMRMAASEVKGGEAFCAACAPWLPGVV